MTLEKACCKSQRGAISKIEGQIEINGQSPAWYALYTHHQHEKSAAQILVGKGLEVLLPLYKTAHRWKDRVKELSLPLFPNYLFVFGGADQRGAVLSTPGVYDFVRLGGAPSPIPDKEIEAVRQVVERSLQVEPHPFLKSGDRIRMKRGPLDGVEGILVRKKGFYRLILSVELLARSIAVEVDVADVERVSQAYRNIGVPKGSFATVAGSY